MAIRVDYADSAYGIPLRGAYLKVVGYTWDVHNVFVTVACYVTEAARQANCQPLSLFSSRLNLPNGGALADIYTALKALPEYTDAEDC